MVEALVAGKRGPRQLAELAQGKLRLTVPQLVEALNGRFGPHHAVVCSQILVTWTRLRSALSALDRDWLDGLDPPPTVDPFDLMVDVSERTQQAEACGDIL